MIPGLNDSEAASILNAAKEAGAEAASHILLRLPVWVQPVLKNGFVVLDLTARIRFWVSSRKHEAENTMTPVGANAWGALESSLTRSGASSRHTKKAWT